LRGIDTTQYIPGLVRNPAFELLDPEIKLGVMRAKEKSRATKRGSTFCKKKPEGRGNPPPF